MVSDKNAEPIVRSATRTESQNIETTVNRMNSGRIVIPDYQRDAEQWDSRKESLFIESLINNLTIPAFFMFKNGDCIEVVDGQQRLTTILKFAKGEMKISDDEGIVYLSPQSALYVGKTINDLPDIFKTCFYDYPLSLINLPENIDLATRLEIFRRINEGGTPLSAQDIRLSYYSSSASVFYVRLAGVYSGSKYHSRIESSATGRNIPLPWGKFPKIKKVWWDWWAGKRLAKGQTPSEMFLWYLVAKYRKALDGLMKSQDSAKHLGLSHRGMTEEALDIFCAQMKYQDENARKVKIICSLGNGLEDDFAEFVGWLNSILSKGLPSLSVDKYKQISLLIAAATELGLDKNLANPIWKELGDFIKAPRQSGNKWLKDGYPEQKGRWGGQNGQFAQCTKAVELVKKVVESNGKCRKK